MEDEKVEDGVLSDGSESFDNDWVGSEDENENEAAEPEVIPLLCSSNSPILYSMMRCL